MPIDTYNLQRTKELILSFIRSRGPSLPVHVAKDIKTSPLFASAFLSELYNEQKVRMSHMRVGSTPLYIVPGQEAQLENFIQYLNRKEQEAVHLLKNNISLEDEKIPPAIRVALRELKDFAIPSKQVIEGQEKIVWKYAFSSADINSISQSQKQLQSHINANPAIASSILQATIPKEENVVQVQEVVKQEPLIQPIQQQEIQKVVPEKKLKIKISKKHIVSPSFSLILSEPTIEIQNLETPFSKSVKEQFKEKGLEILNVELEKKKEFVAIIRTKTTFGYQDYYCIAKDKKKLQETDIPQALQKAQEKRMPVMLMAPGLPDKKTSTLLQQWENLVKFEKLG
ncbi:MAG: hypothetical protein AABX66_00055 [Nanoarchaeota archaeon]